MHKYGAAQTRTVEWMAFCHSCDESWRIIVMDKFMHNNASRPTEHINSMHMGNVNIHRDMHGKASIQILEMDLHPALRPCNLKRMSIYEVFVCENGPRNVVFTFENKKLPNLGTLASHAVQLALSMVQFGFRCMRFMGKLHHFDHFGFDLHSCRCRCS